VKWKTSFEKKGRNLRQEVSSDKLKLLDTSILIGLLRGDENIEEAVSETDEKLSTCFPVKYELYRGTKLARETEEGEKQVEKLINELEALEANSKAAKKTSELKQEHPEVELFDLMIAGICIVHEAEILTRDRDFNKIDKLNKTILE